MQYFTKVISICLLVCIMLPMAIPASASEVMPFGDVGWESEFSNFEEISEEKNASRWNGYTCAIQRFLGAYSSDFSDVLDSMGNPDGYLGPVTGGAIKDYRGMKGLSEDSVVDSDTWVAVQWDLWDTTNDKWTYFSVNGDRVIVAEETNNGYNFSYYYFTQGQLATRLFRSA